MQKSVAYLHTYYGVSLVAGHRPLCVQYGPGKGGCKGEMEVHRTAGEAIATRRGAALAS